MTKTSGTPRCNGSEKHQAALAEIRKKKLQAHRELNAMRAQLKQDTCIIVLIYIRASHLALSVCIVSLIRFTRLVSLAPQIVVSFARRIGDTSG